MVKKHQILLLRSYRALMHSIRALEFDQQFLYTILSEVQVQHKARHKRLNTQEGLQYVHIIYFLSIQRPSGVMGILVASTALRLSILTLIVRFVI